MTVSSRQDKEKLHKTSKCLWPVCIDVCSEMFFSQHFYKSISKNP